MTFGREKRLLLGWLALTGPLPLPFNEVLAWPNLFLYVAAVLYFLQRADRDPERWLPDWALNLLGLVYVPYLIYELRIAARTAQPFSALLHLTMFLLVVKLFSIRREKDKWYVMVAIFFLFIGSMATSSHVTILIFLIPFLALTAFALAALSYWHVLAAFARFRQPERTPGVEPRVHVVRQTSPLPIRRPLLAGTLLVLAVAVPLFATMPRIREPFILGRGGTVGMGRTTGFSDSVDLNLTTTIRANRNVALRIQYDGAVDRPGELRFKGATYERYQNRNWYRLLQHGEELTWSQDRSFLLSAGRESGRALVYQEPLASTSLVVPVEALAVKIDQRRTLGRDPGGALILPGLPSREAMRYEVSLAAEPQMTARFEPDPASPLSALDTSGVSERMRELAAELLGEGEPGERIDRLEQALLTRYAYTLDFVGRDGQNPLEDFLFVYQSGHCEYFASAMVLLLRSQGIPARLVTGFLGAELNRIEGYYIVRQQNAHAWVEAYAPERGWRIYDPTPPDGRPAVAEPSLSLLVTQLWDFVTFRWDRYVLSYGADDQQSFFQQVREWLAELWGKLDKLGEGGPEPDAGPMVVGDPGLSGDFQAPAFRRPGVLAVMLAILVLAAGVAWAWWRRRLPWTGEAAYRRLRRRLEAAGVEVGEAVPPLELERVAGERFPAAAAALRELVALYLRESFAGHTLDGGERERLGAAWRSIQEVVEQGRRKRPPRGAPLPAAP